MDLDDAAREEIERWMDEDEKVDAASRAQQPPISTRIRQRLELVCRLYERFLRDHPKHVKALSAYGSLLTDMGEEERAAREWEKALELDPGDPAVWNNLGNYHSHNGRPRKAFECYEKAISLRESEALYYQNLAAAIYVHHPEAAAYYELNGTQLRNRVLALYRKAMARDPGNFLLATDFAQTYYGLSLLGRDSKDPPPKLEDAYYEEAIEAWKTALRLAPTDEERQGVEVHLARVNIMAGRLEEARKHLDRITNGALAVVKRRLENNLVRKEGQGLTAPPPTLRPAPQAP